MSKKYKCSIQDKIQEITALLTPYCSSENALLFQNSLSKSPISSLLINTYQKAYMPENAKSDEKDPLLYRFSKEEKSYGKMLEHFLGCYYIMDPSSAQISRHLERLLPENFNCCDLCSAPGGKTIAMAIRRRDGNFFANDISYKRQIEMKKNSERLGLENCVLASQDPLTLPLKECFDLVILDAPCSGSGMIRKEEKMLLDYSEDKVKRLLPIQEKLLEKAYSLVNNNGIIAYSTCSFSIEEDENQIKEILKKHPDLKIVNALETSNLITGVDGLGYHLVPGTFQGEGIYFCLLRKEGGERVKLTNITNNTRLIFKGSEYVSKSMMKEYLNINILTPGIKIADDSEYRKCPFNHAYCKLDKSTKRIELTREESLLYVSGMELKKQIEDGLYILQYNQWPIAYSKASQNKLKNALPKALHCSLV